MLPPKRLSFQLVDVAEVRVSVSAWPGFSVGRQMETNHARATTDDVGEYIADTSDTLEYFSMGVV